jgi:hypothetical protein
MRRLFHRPPATLASVMMPLALLLALGACGRHPDEEQSSGGSGTNGVSAPSPAPSVAAVPARTTPPPSTGSGAHGETWNAAQIDWAPYDDGMRRAKQQNKPVLLVVSATWCPHCRNYSHVFDDPRVVQHAQDFVMVRIDADADADVAAKYTRDGGYVPRTYFLAPDGTPNAAIHAPRQRYQYFYDEHDPSALLASMDAEVTAQRH